MSLITLLIPLSCLQTEGLSNPMLAALLDDKTGFVELFLQNGLSLREFLTPQILCQLYSGVSSITPASSYITLGKKTNKKFWLL